MPNDEPKKEREKHKAYTQFTLAEANGRIDKFCEALRDVPVIRYACEAAGINRKTAYNWRNKYKTFAAAWDEALEDGIDKYERTGFKRGEDKSDRMLQFMLKAHRPEKYTPKEKIEHTGGLNIIIDK